MSDRLPTEILQEIFQNLSFKNLFSCTLVNRLWCTAAIPYMWASPFNDSLHKPWALLNTYFNCFGEEEINFLEQQNLVLAPTNDKGMKQSVNVSPKVISVFFAYGSFLKEINSARLLEAIRRWIPIAGYTERLDRKNQLGGSRLCCIFFQCFYRFFIKESQLGLQKLILNISAREIQLALFQTPNASRFLSNLTELTIAGSIPENQVLLKASECCTNLKCLTILSSWLESEGLLTLILFQRSLQSINIGGRNQPLPRATLDVIMSQMWGLKEVTLLFIVCLPSQLFSGNKCLERLTICDNHPSTFGTGSAFGWADAKFPSLKSLVLKLNSMDHRMFAKMIESTEGCLEELTLSWRRSCKYETSEYIAETIAKNCPNLTLLILENIDDMLHFIPIILQKCSLLQYLQLSVLQVTQPIDVSKKLPDWGYNLPSNLRCLNISATRFKFKPAALEKFLLRCSPNLTNTLKLSFEKDLSAVYIRILQKYGEEVFPRDNGSARNFYENRIAKSSGDILISSAL
ncbi:hypothetical protein G9A89_005400 [Geosiphon pyriformis]|nr:hypothetical protein G9A89_005400 [Geosiphon pyriformis]